MHLPGPWAGFNPNTPAGATSTTPSLLDAVLPSAYVITPKLVPQVNTALLLSVEVISTSPLTVQYVINPSAVWSDGVPVSAADFVYAWRSQRGDGIDVDGRPDEVRHFDGMGAGEFAGSVAPGDGEAGEGRVRFDV